MRWRSSLGKLGGPQRSYMECFHSCGPASMQIYWNKKKRLHKEKSLTPTGFVWDTNMAAVTSCENTLRALPHGVTPFSFIYHFWKKIPPIIYIVLTNVSLFHILSLELCSPFNCWKCTIFLKNMNKSENKYDSVLSFSQPKMRLLVGF